MANRQAFLVLPGLSEIYRAQKLTQRMALYPYIDACYKRLLAGSASSPLPTVPDFPRQVVKAISNRLGLLFIAEKVAGGNLCLANAEEVRPEYRTTFSTGD